MKEVLFDLYGTIIDLWTDEQDPRFWITFSKKVRKYKEYDPLELKNKYLSICERLSKEKEEIELLDTFKELFLTADVNEIAWLFRKTSTKYIRVFKGAKKCLKRLKKDGYKICLLSNAQSCFTVKEMKMLHLDKYFDNKALSSNYGIKKPNKDFFTKAMKDFNLTNPIMIGNDYNCDIAPAKDLGLKTIYIEKYDAQNKIETTKVIGADYNKIYQMIKNIDKEER